MKKRQLILKPLLAIILCFISIVCFSQNPTDSLPDDPGAGSVSVYTLQNMSFGAFSCGNLGGTVNITPTGTRTVNGTIIPYNISILPYFNAIFEIEAPVGAIISILNGPDVTLTGSNGGSMSLHLTTSNPVSPFTTTVSPPGRTQVGIGGTLTVGTAASTPSGSYNATIYITFNNE